MLSLKLMTTTIFCLLVFRFKFDCRAVAGKQVKGKKWNLFINHFFENFCLFVHIDNYFSVKLSSKKKFFKNDVFSKIKINESHAPASAFTEKIITFLHYFSHSPGFTVMLLHALLAFKASAYTELMPAFTTTFQRASFSHAHKNVG